MTRRHYTEADAQMAAHDRLGQTLRTRAHIAADDDPEEPSEIAALWTAQRVYKPKGKPLAILAALRAGGPMTSADLAKIGECHPKQMVSLLASAADHGLVRRAVRSDELAQCWEAI